MTKLKFLFLTMTVVGFAICLSAANPQPPPSIAFCAVEDQWLEKFIEVDGLLLHFEIPAESPPGTANLKLMSPDCPKAGPVLVSLNYCGKCECWETRSERIWEVIKGLRAGKYATAKTKMRGELRKSEDQRFGYLFVVNCIQNIDPGTQEPKTP